MCHTLYKSSELVISFRKKNVIIEAESRNAIYDKYEMIFNNNLLQSYIEIIAAGA